MKRKRILLCLIFSVLLFFSLSALTVYAHPGKTDSNGGHWDRSTGEYHYHHGYEAHSHHDIDGNGTIDCPYAFDDQTGSRSGSKSNSSPNSSSNLPRLPDKAKYSSASVPTFETLPDAYYREYNSTSNSIPAKNFLSVFIFSACILIPGLGLAFFADSRAGIHPIDEFSEPRVLPKKEETPPDLSEKTDAIKLFCTTYNVDDPGIPPDIEFIDGFIPVKGKVSPSMPYGEYTVFISLTGKRYHRNPRCQRVSLISVHLYETGFRYSPCSKCASGTNNHVPEWYSKIKDIIIEHK